MITAEAVQKYVEWSASKISNEDHFKFALACCVIESALNNPLRLKDLRKKIERVQKEMEATK